MKLTPELLSLAQIATATQLMWLPHVLERMMAQGVFGAIGNAAPLAAVGRAWARRSRLAHDNAIANLAVFAALVLTAAVAGISTPATVVAAQVYVGARLLHYVAYTAGIPGVRTVSFLTGVGAALVFPAAIFAAA